MSLDKLKRNLISCGKDFFIDNFQELENFHKNLISSDKVDELIAAKKKWKDISTIANRRSTVKILFDNNQILDALKITINSRAEKEVIQKALEYFEIKANRPYDEKVDRIEVSDNDEQTINQSKNLKTINMNIPLNQIFYGPPGTGKTFKISSEAENIINLTSSKEKISIEESFDRIVKNIRLEYDESIYNTLNGNNIYRNFTKAMVVWGYFLDPKYDESNTIIHNDLKDLRGFKRSGWSQRIRYLTEFGFIEGDWKNDLSGQLGFDMQLSESGILLKNNLREFIHSQGTPNESSLKNWTRDSGLPNIIIQSYIETLKEVSFNSKNITAFQKTIFCALNMCLKGDLFKINSENNRTTTEDEIALVQQYFDVNNTTNSDYKWVGWIAENLVDLNLVQVVPEEKLERYYFELTQTGHILINDIVKNWKYENSTLFDEDLTYEVGIRLGQIDFITFHQSYSYEDFIEGIRPNLDGENNLSYTLETGVFKRISDRAKHDQENNYVIIIDEINRGNISKIFGELITLIEPSKRLFEDNDEHPKQVTLPYSKKRFGVPKNLYILGTMNTADKSIALLDSALRRRFEFVEMLPDSSILTEKKVKVEGIEIETLLDTINQRIEFLIDKDHAIGHSYFLKDSFKKNPTVKNLANIFKNEIIPLLQEYFYGDFEKIQLVLGDNKERKPNEVGFFKKKPSQQMALFGTSELDGYDDKEIYELSPIFKTNDKEELTKLFESVYKSN